MSTSAHRPLARTVARPALLALLALGVGLPAQMSGTYTIDPSGSGGRNYKTIMGAVQDLWKNGISAPVDFVVASGIWTETIYMVPIQGMAQTRRITFRSKVRHGAILDRPVNFSFHAPSTPITDLVFDGFVLRGSSSHFGGGANRVEIHHCKCSSRINVSGADWRVHHCSFTGANGMITAGQCSGCHLYNNEFRDSRLQFSHQVPPFGSRRLRVYNNTFVAKFTPVLIRSNHVDFVHNTVVLKTTSSGHSCLDVTAGFFTQPTRLIGNLFVLEGAGPILRLHTTDPLRLTSNGNLFHAINSKYFVIAQSISYANLTAWQLTGHDRNSLVGDPQFVGGRAYTDLHIKPTSAAINRAVGTPAYVTTDMDDEPRQGIADIGADEARVPFDVFGKGCAGTGNIVPRMGYSGSPVIGSTNFTVNLTNAVGGSTSRAWFVIGVSDKTWGPLKLPFDFGGGCRLLVSAEFLVQVGISGLPGAGNGTASVKLNIPNDPKLKGSRTFLQWAVVDAAAKGIGLAFSNGGLLAL